MLGRLNTPEEAYNYKLGAAKALGHSDVISQLESNLEQEQHTRGEVSSALEQVAAAA